MWVALTVLIAFAAAPYSHLHRREAHRAPAPDHHHAHGAVVHAHLSAHASPHATDGPVVASPAEEEAVISLATFIFDTPHVTPAVAEVPMAPAVPVLSLLGRQVRLPQPRAHAPPSLERRSIRAPPVDPPIVS